MISCSWAYFCCSWRIRKWDIRVYGYSRTSPKSSKKSLFAFSNPLNPHLSCMTEVDLMGEINRGAELSPGFTWWGCFIKRTGTSYILCSAYHIMWLLLWQYILWGYTNHHRLRTCLWFCTNWVPRCWTRVCFANRTLFIWRLHLVQGQLQLSRLLCPGQNQLSAGVVQVQVVHVHTHLNHVLHRLYTARNRRRKRKNASGESVNESTWFAYVIQSVKSDAILGKRKLNASTHAYRSNYRGLHGRSQAV